MEEQIDNPLAWLDPFRRRFHISPSSALPGGASSQVECGRLQLVRLSAGKQHLRLAHREGQASSLVGIIQREGSAIVQQGAVSRTLPPRQLALLTSELPFDVEFGDAPPALQTWLLLPAEMLRGIYPEAQQLFPGIIQCAEPHAQMLDALSVPLCASAGALPGHAHIAQAITHLLAAALLSQARTEAPSRTSLASFHISRIKQFALANLHDPELTVRQVSAKLRISPSHLHRVFLNERQTFAEWLWDQRLDACREALEKTGGAGVSISEIAFRHGFSNSSHFSRAFKARFGMSPSEARAHKKSRSGL
jgi:AraC-like DNA-binding protein